MNHYYTENPELAHDLESWSFPLRGWTFQFTTDSEVFLRGIVDYGSRVLIDAFEWENLPAGRLLDVGCGYEPIELSLAAATGRLAEMVDVNQRAVGLAQMDAQRNQITTVDIHSSNMYETLNETTCATIVSNPPIRTGRKAVHDILTGAFPLLKVGSTLTAVTQKKQGVPSAEKKAAEIFGNVEIVTKDKGYYTLRNVKEAE